MVKKFVEFLYVGKTRNVYIKQEVENLKIEELNIPQKVVGFRFFTQRVTKINGHSIKGKRQYESWYYYGKEMSLRKAWKQGKISDDKYHDYEMYGYQRVVITEEGKVFPLNYSDCVISRT